MATSDKGASAKRSPRAYTAATIAQLTKLRDLAKRHPTMTVASCKEGLLLAFLPAWLSEGWIYKGDLIAGTEDASSISHLLPSDGKLTGYCERKPDAAQAPFCGTRADRMPKAAKRLTWTAYDPDALTSALLRKREAARKAA